MKVTTAIAGASESEVQQIQRSLAAFPSVNVDRIFPHYPDQLELQPFLRAVDPHILFVSTLVPSRMEDLVQRSIHILPHLQVVLLDGKEELNTLRSAMKLGVRECLSAPFRAEDLRGAIERSMARRETIPETKGEANGLYSFLPARPGVGATTLAMQTALHLPAKDSQRALLIDTDFDAGLIQFLLRVRTPYSIIDAMERVEQLDERLWPQLVEERGHLDVMQSGTGGGDYRPDLARLQFLVEFMRKVYGTILVDLPGAVNRLAVEIMQQSRAVFLVTTQEVASLHMARKRLRELQDLQLGKQVRLVVNRVEKRGGLAFSEIAKMVGAPVELSFANDYAETQKAIVDGKQIPAAAPLGRQLADFARSLSTAPVEIVPQKRRRFLEVFALQR